MARAWLATCVRAYRRKYAPRLRDNLEYYVGLRDLAVVVEKAALGLRRDGKRQAHQRRIPLETLEEWSKRLGAMVQAIGRCRNFHELLLLLGSQRLPGIGELTLYDTALRIGAHLRLFPDRVYLHAGTRRGARILGLDTDGDSLSMRQLPQALMVLAPYEVEDFLCIFKGCLRPLAMGCNRGAASP